MLIMSSLAFLLLLCLSCQACTARPLRSTQNETGKYQYDKDLLDKVDLLETSLTESRSRSFTLEENLTGQLQHVTNNYKANICETCGKASTLNGVVVETSGTEVTVSSYQTDLPFTHKTKGMRRHARSTLGHAGPQHQVEETDDPNANDAAVPDIVEMDYAQPHRKPPIHNEKP